MDQVFDDMIRFFERIFGWLVYVLGNADDPYEYDGVIRGFFGRYF